MNRIPRLPGNRRHAFFGALVLLAVTTSSVSAADGGPGPLGVTTVAKATMAGAKVGALFGAGDSLEGGHFCTASVVHSPRGDLIVTAAHCLSGGTMWFAPGYREGRAPYGVWKVTRTFVDDAWSGDEDEDSDVGFATLESIGGVDVEDVVEANRFVTGRATGATAVTVTGYPDSEETPITCTNKPAVLSSTQQSIDCPGFTSGTSGSPWVNADGEVVGVLGGHEQGGSTPDVSYSVVLGDEAADLYRAASGLQ
ncbi:trypsin-like peptidase domain-containing protein [Streptomyces chiangmaiensis]|uniref:Trypsin-like peptidase domain-containing protein n=1 Tax=Streptomyces chiangmaiensis TaxID=766497 RepID=A0ABU7FF46_9ACTN|nr:trypsin-like peptidase domain-containing protein [Streptomyces chiangmaiensis]MED7822544.1 trypsin-like peptidase domain-containing protein [Streptomyces chiangmaiensis]